MSRLPSRILPLLVLWLLVLVPTASPAAQVLKISTIVPAGTAFMQELRAAEEEIHRQTDGRVQLKLFPGGVMGSDRSVLRKIRIGQLHGAVITAVGLQNLHPDTQVYSLPFTFRSYEEVEYVRARLDPEIRDRVARAGFVLGGLAEGGFTYLFSKQPIRTLEDLRDKRMWSPEGDDVTRRMLERAGIKVVSLPVSDVYTSLQTGLVDVVTINPSGAIGLQWHTGVNYQLDAPLLLLMAMLVFDDRALARLEPADREAVMKIFRETFERLDGINRRANREAQEALRGLGIELLQPARPPDERQWQKVADRALQELAADGAFNSELYQRVKSLVAEYRSRTAAQ
ncbi:MAG: TRAP transporter substrate-binding protein DctP [Halofilum sp. (in: g-proteobacteria)]|nr:TRAP transporter substrate-binding protein DctP [Halofilum sp. (in: g-proteobacteria)]